MTSQVVQVETGPPHRWHPRYASIREWLDNEAPVELPSPVDNPTKARNWARFRVRRA